MISGESVDDFCVIRGHTFFIFSQCFVLGKRCVNRGTYISSGAFRSEISDLFCQCFLLLPCHDPEFSQFW